MCPSTAREKTKRETREIISGEKDESTRIFGRMENVRSATEEPRERETLYRLGRARASVRESEREREREERCIEYTAPK